MPSVFVGSTELTIVGTVKIGTTDVQEIYVGSTKVFPTNGGDPSITFQWDPVNGTTLPSGTFTRASVAQEYNGTSFTERASGVIRENSAAVPGGAKGYLSEPSTTNLVINNDLTDAVWTNTGLTVTDNGVNVLGLNEYELDSGTGPGAHNLNDVIGDGNPGTFYVIAEQETGGRFAALVRGNDSASDYGVVDLQTGASSETGAGITADFALPVSASQYLYGIRTNDTFNNSRITVSDTGTPGTGNPSYTGANEKINVCHAQYTNQQFPTTPVISSGVTSSREPDVLDTDVTITSEYSVLIDVTLPTILISPSTLSLIGPDATSLTIIRVNSSWDVIMEDGGTPVTVGTVSAGARFKIAYGRDGSGRSASLDGATAVTGGAPGAGHEGNSFQIGCANSTNHSRGIHHEQILYNEKKSEAELEALSA